MAMIETNARTSFWLLWKEFLPLSLSDVTMACGDPLITTSLARLPSARQDIAALGIAKSLAVLFESPIIMILHASNALASSRDSMKALWRFVLLSSAFLTVFLIVLTVPDIFYPVARNIIGIDQQVAERARTILMMLIIWPAAIAWRRYFQGLLIHGGHTRAVGRASLARLTAIVVVLLAGLHLSISGEILAGLALLTGILIETAWVSHAAYHAGVTRKEPQNIDSHKPRTLKAVLRFYWPLANSMMVVWGGRALLIAVIARSWDSSIALAAWPAAWAIVLVVANATRMVQQVIIRNRKLASTTVLLQFSASVGLVCTLLLCTIAFTPAGHAILQSFLGNDPQLVDATRPIIAFCSIVPLFVSLQNAFQGFLISEGLTGRINTATWIGTTTLIIASVTLIGLGLPGAKAASLAMVMGLFLETLWIAMAMLHIVNAEESVSANVKTP